MTACSSAGRPSRSARSKSGGTIRPASMLPRSSQSSRSATLAASPEIWFLDEPFSALDPLIRREMQDEFLRLQNVLHKTIAFITHDFEEAVRLADRIAIMQDGRVIQIGTPEDLATAPATSYVAEFTREIPRAKVLSVRAIMAPAGTDGFAGEVAATTKIELL